MALNIAAKGEEIEGLEEARWILEMVKDPNSTVQGVVASIPLKQGAKKTQEFLNYLKEADGKLPKGLKGTRQFFNFPENTGETAKNNATFYEGLKKMHEMDPNLVFEFNVKQEGQLAEFTSVISDFPDIQFVMDHYGYQNGTDIL